MPTSERRGDGHLLSLLMLVKPVRGGWLWFSIITYADLPLPMAVVSISGRIAGSLTSPRIRHYSF
eukprot:6207267-Pleurochrysis_carterae.AAC.1